MAGERARSHERLPRSRARLQELTREHGLSEGQQGALQALLEALRTDARAPTAVTDPDAAVDAHVADSLAALQLDAVRSAAAVVDIGSGSGLPGLVLAAALESARVWLVESQARRCEFLRATAGRMGLANVEVVCERVEAWHAGAASADVAVARAVAAQPVVLEYAAPLLRTDGALVDWRGPRAAEEQQAATRAAAELGLEPAGVYEVPPFPGADRHALHVFVKAAETPPRFPRRPGVARKRPLG
jgi:16S rRNA (guanine527-N7)-methyltransferase